MKRRASTIERHTTETQIRARLVLEGRGRSRVRTGVRFLDHMLELFARHGGFDLEVRASGDLDVDQHHTVEDVGIVLGQCFDRALGDRRGINRAGYFLMPMDETLALAAVDSAAGPRWSTRRPSASGWWETCKPSCWRISSAASPRRPAPTST